MSKNIVVNKVNEDKIKEGPSKLKAMNYGNGKI